MKSIRLCCLALIMLVPFAQMANAAMKIAVVDRQLVLTGSDIAKKYEKTAEAKFGPQVKKLKVLEDELVKMQKKLEKDGPTLTESQRENRQLDIKRKYEDLQLNDRQFRMEKAKSDQAVVAQIRPKLEKAINEVFTESGYDMFIWREAAAAVKPEYDITRKVIERLNKMK